MQIKNRKLFIWLPLLAAWVFDLLFWQKVPGISFAIFVAVVVAVGLFLAYREGVRPAPLTLLLLLPTAFFAAMTFIRMEPLTTLLNYLATLVILAIFAHTFIGGEWPFYRLFNYIGAMFSLMIDVLTKAIPLMTKKTEADGSESDNKPTGLWGAIFRGLVIAAPLVLVLTVLLTSADAIFEARVQDVINFIDLDNLPEYIGRGLLILAISYMLAGVYLHAIMKNNDSEVRKQNEASSFLGFIESTVILGSVNLLFLAFVIVQFRYFFGGNANIHIDGFTYAEYARRGFGELVATAFISLLLLQLLTAFFHYEGKKQYRTFSALGVMLVLLVGVMLVSALQRLLLYENAYGFSRLRTYTHVYIYWLAVLLVATIVLIIFRQRRFFMLSMLLAATGFIATLDVMNVDGYIVNRNITRAMESGNHEIVDTGNGGRNGNWERFDFQYLATLSPDALPTLAHHFMNSDEPDQHLAAAIACHAHRYKNYNYEEFYYFKYTWASFHFSRSQALKEWQSLMKLPDSSDLKVKHEVVDDYDQYYVLIDGEKHDCYSSNWVD